MSLNTAHANNGVLIHTGEYILIFSDSVTLQFDGQPAAEFLGKKTGRLYLTTHRMIFNNKATNDPLQSFSFPFVTLSQVELEQPMFGANYLKGKVTAQPNGNFTGTAAFKLQFKSGGCIEFGQAMLRAAQLATRNAQNTAPPPYTPPTGPWYAAPPPAYQPSPQGYYGWMPPTDQFPNAPPPNTVFMSDNPPPYPGLVPNGGYNQVPTAPGAPPMYPQLNQYGNPPNYPSQPGAQGWANPTAPPNSKAAEAAQSAYYDPNQPQTAYVPPPSYYEQPPSYQNATNKKDN
uniref:Putative ww domain binding protein wbp-2 n=1 Tax=Xenopsylla cheopis TaxID=163159 RepID=A0A6M2DRB3_XENCH